ncbi:hypothetical protein GCM10020331_018820 [Ectobacillus funiculus]
MNDYEIDVDVLPDSIQLIPERIQIARGDLHAGFELPMQRLVVITEKELFLIKKGEKKPQRRQKAL